MDVDIIDLVRDDEDPHSASDEPVLTPTTVLEQLGVDPTAAKALATLRSIPSSPSPSVPFFSRRDAARCSITGSEGRKGGNVDGMAEIIRPVPVRAWTTPRASSSASITSAVSGLSAFSFHFGGADPDTDGGPQDCSESWTPVECPLEQADTRIYFGIDLPHVISPDYNPPSPSSVSTFESQSSALTALDVLRALAHGIDENELEVHRNSVISQDPSELMPRILLDIRTDSSSHSPTSPPPPTKGAHSSRRHSAPPVKTARSQTRPELPPLNNRAASSADSAGGSYLHLDNKRRSWQMNRIVEAPTAESTAAARRESELQFPTSPTPDSAASPHVHFRHASGQKQQEKEQPHTRSQSHVARQELRGREEHPRLSLASLRRSLSLSGLAGRMKSPAPRNGPSALRPSGNDNQRESPIQRQAHQRRRGQLSMSTLTLTSVNAATPTSQSTSMSRSYSTPPVLSDFVKYPEHDTLGRHGSPMPPPPQIRHYQPSRHVSRSTPSRVDTHRRRCSMGTHTSLEWVPSTPQAMTLPDPPSQPPSVPTSPLDPAAYETQVEGSADTTGGKQSDAGLGHQEWSVHHGPTSAQPTINFSPHIDQVDVALESLTSNSLLDFNTVESPSRLTSPIHTDQHDLSLSAKADASPTLAPTPSSSSLVSLGQVTPNDLEHSHSLPPQSPRPLEPAEEAPGAPSSPTTGDPSSHSSSHVVAPPLADEETLESSPTMIVPPTFYDDRMYFDRKVKTPKSKPPTPTKTPSMEDNKSLKKKKKKAKKHDSNESFLVGFLDAPPDDKSVHSNAGIRGVVNIPPSSQPQTPPMPPHTFLASRPAPMPPVPPLSPRSSTLRLDLPPEQPMTGSAQIRQQYQAQQQQQQQHQQQHQGIYLSEDGMSSPISLTGSKRASRLSQYTVSSLSSEQSLGSSNNRHNGGQPLWPSLSDRGRSFATVFEDEPLDSGGLELEFSDPWSKDPSSPPSLNRASSLGLSSSSSIPPSPASHVRQPLPPVNRGSLSPMTVGGPKSIKKNHPFAKDRAPSPLLERPDYPPAAKQSRSAPALYDQYNRMAEPSQPLQVTLLSPQQEDDTVECPVCCESLSATFRLPGEKPHIVPECGHTLHEECFVTVYGQVPPEGSSLHIGVCGLCRQPMRVASGAGSDRAGKSKLAALIGGENSGMITPQQESSVHHLDNDDNDPVELSTLVAVRTPPADGTVKVVIPSITIKTEYPSVRRSRGGGSKQRVSAMVTVSMPPAVDRSQYAARARQDSLSSAEQQLSPRLPPSPISTGSTRESMILPGFHGKEPSSPNAVLNPFYAHVQADLRRRVIGYKYAGLEVIGQLHLFDILRVRKGPVHKEFHVYLFQDALVCIQEERKPSIRNLFKNSSNDQSANSVLKLKGRIYLRHVSYVSDSSNPAERSLQFTMEAEVDGSDMFSICFKDQASLDLWRTTLTRLIEEAKDPNSSAATAAASAAKAAKVNNMAIVGQSPAATTSTSLAPTFSDFEAHPPVTACPSGCLGDLAYSIPIAPHHTPVDLVIAVSTQTYPTTNGSLPLKARLLRSSLQFVLACMGPKDRVALVATELGPNGTVRKTPLLNATYHDSRLRLEMFIEALGSGAAPHDEFEAKVLPEERPDVVTAINIALDVVLQRKDKNPLTGIVLISDTGDAIKRGQMSMVTARLDAAKVPVHTFGYGKAHDPSPLWMISNHTHGTYTFVKEWYHLRDALAGVVGGFTSIALTNMKLRLTTQHQDFRVAKVAGTSTAVVSTSGKDIDIELAVLRHDERREILIEFELEGDAEENGGRKDSIVSTAPSASSMMSRPSLRGDEAGSLGFQDGYNEDGAMDEVPVVEVDCSFHDPEAGRSAARLSNPVLLTIAILPFSSAPSNAPGDPHIVRRRMELLASDMITRSLLIASRKNFGHATRILGETKRVIETMASNMRASLPPQGQLRLRRDIATKMAIDGLSATLQDVEMFLEGLEVNKEMFEMDLRNFAAQQAIILRSQRSWTNRTPTELNYATPDVQALIQASADYATRT